MLVELLKSKIHRVTVTEANLSYIGSITIDTDLIEAANILPGEKVQIVNNNMGLASRPTSSLESEDQVSSASTELQPVWCSLAIP